MMPIPEFSVTDRANNLFSEEQIYCFKELKNIIRNNR